MRWRLPEVYFGWKAVCYRDFVAENLFSLFLVAIVAVIGICTMVTGIVLRFKKMPAHDFIVLGLVTMVAACGMALDSNIGYLISPNSFASYYLSSVTLSLAPFVCIVLMHFHKYVSLNDSISRLFTYSSVGNVFLVTAGAFIKFIPFSLFRYFAAGMETLLLGYMILFVMHDVIVTKKHMDGFDFVIVFGGLSILVDFLVVALNLWHDDLYFFTRIGMIVLMGYCSMEMFVNMLDGQIAKAKADVFRAAVTTDLQTGLLIGSSMWDRSHDSDFIIMLFGIANVQEIQRVRGQSECEQVLRAVARMLNAVFADDSVYKLSRGIFAVITESKDESGCGKAVQQIQAMVDDYNNLNLGYTTTVLCSGSRYHAESDSDFDGLYIKLLEDLHRKEMSHVRGDTSLILNKN